MLDLTNLMLDDHHMNLVHRYLSVRDIIVFYTISIYIIKVSHLPLHKGLILYEYPFFSYKGFFSNGVYFDLYFDFKYLVYYNYYPASNNFEHSIFVYALLKAQSFDDIVAYFGTININDREKMLLYEYAIAESFNDNWDIDYMILPLYNKFTKPYFYVCKYNNLFDLENYNKNADFLQYMVGLNKTATLLTNKYIKWNYPKLLRFIDKDKVHLVKNFTSCKTTVHIYIHKSYCKSHQICEMLNSMCLFEYYINNK